MENKYYLGLDIGTESVGWAVTDELYQLKRVKGKDLWGVRLFESGKSAEERRTFRAARRRGQRKVKRIAYLQELFQEEIAKVDIGFYDRLKDGFFRIDDKLIRQPNTLFNDKNYTDKEYYKAYPTIYHLRKELIESTEKKDIRLIYLGVAHILKKRGHFLFEGQDLSAVSSFENIYLTLVNCLNEVLDLDFSTDKMGELEVILKDKVGVKAKKDRLFELLGKGDKQKQAFIGLLSGGKVNLYDLFMDEGLKDVEKKDILFIDSSYEENYDLYSSILLDKMCCIEYAKAVYDWSVLSNILKKHQYISFAKVEDYDKHHEDLVKLKDFLRIYGTKKIYKDVFEDENNLKNYCGYIGKSKEKDNKSTCSADDFYGYIKKILLSIKVESEEKEYIFQEIEKRSFLPKQVTGDNGVIPYQLHLEELRMILKNASVHYPFLLEKDEKGISIEEKVLQIMQFRIPYYIGPLNDAHKDLKGSNCWIIRKEGGTIYPWNLEEKVDINGTAEQFIMRMTNKCTYIVGADVLPKYSILYSKFAVLNEINNLRINGEKISVSLKQDIFNNLFMIRKNVTQKALKNYLYTIGAMQKTDEISGIDGDIKGSLISIIELQNILGDKARDEEKMEDIIKTITLFGEERKLIICRLTNAYGGILTKEEIKEISKLKYSGWGRLSREVLSEIDGVDLETGEILNIINRLFETNENFMQLLSGSYSYKEKIDKFNQEQMVGETAFTYEALMEHLYCSPAVKRAIWQTLTIVKEIRKVMGSDPQKIFIEVAREDGEKKSTISRKNKLIGLYRSCKKEERDWFKEIDGFSDDELRGDKLYLYYTQMGKCMYSGEDISLHDLFKKDIYDIDHIYPQSKTKDDSLENRVLVRKDLNSHVKKDLYPLPSALRTPKTMELWYRLYKMGLIGKIKYDRLIRTDGFSQEELAGFINRQLVETRQSTKAVAEILQKVFPESRLVYSKAGNVSQFRQKYEFVKVRELNDLHHAKDAYLNIVVGNVYDTKFTKSPLNFIKEKQVYSLNRMYDFDVMRGGNVAWKRGADGTIQMVRRVMYSDRILFTRYAYEMTGGFSSQQPLKKGKGQLPLKRMDERYRIDSYGGYDSVSSAYFVLVRHMEKGKAVKTIEYVPIYLSKQIEDGALILEEYCRQCLGLTSPQVLVPKIKKFTLFKVDGFPMHITGRTGNRLIFAPAVQLQLDLENQKYLKEIVKFNERNSKTSQKDYRVSEKSEINIVKNLEVYDILIAKHENSIFGKRPVLLNHVMEEGREKFLKLTLEEQCIALFQILKYFKCIAAFSDFGLIGGSKNTGRVQISKKVTGEKSFKIINQSPTGLFTNEIDMNEL